MVGNSSSNDISKIHLETDRRRVIGDVSKTLKHKSLGILCRWPLLDEDYPEVSDVDLLSIWDGPEELPNRIVATVSSGRVFVDIVWIPLSAMVDPVKAASYRILPHLLLGSKVVWLRSDEIKSLIGQIKLNTYEKDIWNRRLGNQINFGDVALLEASRNLDFPQASQFFLQIAHSYYMMALGDSLKRKITSFITRPIIKLKNIDAETGCRLEDMLKANLYLGTNPSVQLSALRRISNVIRSKCRGQMPLGMSLKTAGHFAYMFSPMELDYREMVADAMIKKGDYANASIYIRFMAYSLARCPIVFEEAGNGRDPSFFVPNQPLKKSLQQTCPEIIDDLTLILGEKLTRAQVESSITGTLSFRSVVMEQINKRGTRILRHNNEIVKELIEEYKK